MSASGHFRLHQRQSVDLGAVLLDCELGHEHVLRIVNLGLGGACVETAQPLATGVPVQLEIQAPTLWDPLALSGAVVWASCGTDPVRMGVRFEHLDPVALFALLELLGDQGRTT